MYLRIMVHLFFCNYAFRMQNCRQIMFTRFAVVTASFVDCG
jgi:hypothetical protein